MTTKVQNFTVWTLIALVVGNAVGAGIYTTSGFSLADLGSREWVLLAWIVAGLVALAGAISYGMLVQGITESGGEYLYLSRSIHPVAGFIAGWVSLIAGFPGAIAFAALAFATYTQAAFTQLTIFPASLLAIAVTLMAGAIHFFRVKAGTTIHEWVVSGFNAAAYVAGEVSDARHAVPRGMVLGTLLTMFLCVGLNAIMLYGAPVDLIAAKPDIAARVAESMGGVATRRAMELVIAVSLLTSITAMVLAGPRVYAKMAEDGALPSLFAARSGRPPRASIALQVVMAMLLIVIADLRGLLSYLGFTLSLCLALAVSSLFFRHRLLGERPASIWYPLAPMIFVACTVLFAVLSAINDQRQLFAAIPAVFLGIIAYAISERSK